jgi:hypothetical protein
MRVGGLHDIVSRGNWLIRDEKRASVLANEGNMERIPSFGG